MLTLLEGHLFNQPLDFEFKSGDRFPEGFEYSGMRRFHSFIASFIPVFGYLILKEIGYSYQRSIMSFLFIFENGFTSIGRLILLDSHLLTFTASRCLFHDKIILQLKEIHKYTLPFLASVDLGMRSKYQMDRLPN